jgi:hypothetical protein
MHMLYRKSEEKTSENNIKVDFGEMHCEDMDWY